MGPARLTFKLPRLSNSGYSSLGNKLGRTVMTWWGWLIIGAILLGAELLAVDAQFYLVFLGLSAALVGLAGMFGIVMPE